MTWEPLGVTRALVTAPAMVATSAGAGRLPSLLQVTLRPHLLPHLDFVKAGGHCQVLFGRGADAGRLRIVPGAASTFFALGRKGFQGGALTVRVKAPDGIKPMKRGPDAVEFTHGEDWLELKLPAWAVAVERVTQPAPRTSIMARVPDPAAPLRGPGR